VESVWGRLKFLDTVPREDHLRALTHVQRRLIMWLCDQFNIPYDIPVNGMYDVTDREGFEEMLRAVGYRAGIRLLEEPNVYHIRA